MIKVGTAILKNNLSHYLAKVRKGVFVIVTDRGKPIAKLSPIETQVNSFADEILAQLVKEGLITYTFSKEKFSIWPKIKIQNNQASKIVIEDRE